MGRQGQKRDIDESNRYRSRIGADIEKQKIMTEEEIRTEETRTNQKDPQYIKEMSDCCLDS